ncbi:PilZ domain-containing protein [Qipengyuania vesicularis]|uniref:PilZ domain-containing protein n=1 Tax=Qipengyuania vesicularis TaxID=2867232 RepID=UPI001C884738|nr:PilZ domain-containing protein [Qipengyuania vesicularis]
MYTERRNEDRRDSKESVRFELCGQLHFGTMRNLSQAGCMIESPGIEAEIGARCEIRLIPGYVASGRIAWQLGEAIGISFHLPIPIGLVREYSLDDWPMRAENIQ